MAYKDITSLLKKKGWTGDEVGKAIILSLIDAYKQTLSGVTNPKELFSSAQLKTMINSLKDAEQGTRYNRYVGLNNWVSQNNAIALSYYNQVRGELNILLAIIATATTAEDVYKYIEKLPAIMTQKQYNEIRKNKIEERLTDENGTDDIGHSIFNLIELAIDHFVKLLQNEPKRANPLKPIKKKYQTAPVTSQRILSNYNKIMGEGYYTLEDGRRSDQMTDEEWREALTTPKMKKAFEEMSEAGTLGSGIQGHTAAEIVMQRILNRDHIIFNGGTNEDADKTQYENNVKRGYTIPATWHYYEEPPEDLTKWDIIENLSLLEYFPALSGETSETDSYINQVKDFKAEFPELYNVIIMEIDKNFFKGEGGISKLSLEEWETTVFSFRELYNKNYYGFREFIENDTSIFDGNHRALFNGIAILRPSDLLNKSPRIDENGYYTEPEQVGVFSSSIGLEQYTELNPEYLECIARLEQSYNLIEESYYFLKGYDKAVELIADYIGLPDFDIFKIGHEPVGEQIEAYNNLVSILYRQIKEREYTDEQAKKRKLEVLQDYFQPLKTKELIIPDEAIEDAKALLYDNMEAFAIQNGVFLRLLTTREEGE